MSWYERVAGDPRGSLERLAERQGLTVEQLQSRHRRVAGVLGGEGAALHLGAGDWRQFRDAPERLSEPKRAHLDDCAFCQRLGNAFTGEAVAGRTRRTADAADVWSAGGHDPVPVMGLMTPGRESAGPAAALSAPSPWLQPMMVLPMLAVALVTALVTAGVTTSFSRPTAAPAPAFDTTAFLAVDSVMLPEASRPTSPVALLAASELESGWEGAACAANTWTVSEVTQQSMQLTWESQSNEELPQACRAHGEDISDALDDMARRAESSSLSVGQNVLVVSPATAR